MSRMHMNTSRRRARQKAAAAMAAEASDEVTRRALVKAGIKPARAKKERKQQLAGSPTALKHLTA